MVDTSPEAIEKAILGYLLTDVQDNSSSQAAKALIIILDKKLKERAEETHEKKMEELKGDPIGLSGYLGRLGILREEVEEILGKELTGDTLKAYNEGWRSRRIRIRAVELDQALRGSGDVKGWMTE